MLNNVEMNINNSTKERDSIYTDASLSDEEGFANDTLGMI
jgi:hypothetical protein